MDNDIMTVGKYRFQRYANIPTAYLKDHALKISDDRLLNYVLMRERMERAGEREKVVTDRIPCNKFAYESSEVAEKMLRKIDAAEQKHAKPTRAYLCKKCGLWHLTKKEFRPR